MSLSESEFGAQCQALAASSASDNFVYAVGYGLERIHTGVLAYAITHDKFGLDVAQRLLDHLQIRRPVVTRPECFREKKIGKRCVVDLVLNCDHKTLPVTTVAVEFKVDGTVDHEGQCARMHEALRSSVGESRVGLAVLGGAEFWDAPSNTSVIRLEDFIALYEDLKPRDALIAQYVRALEDECIRRQIAFEVVATREEWRPLGYRGYDLWYATYDIIRKSMSTQSRTHWSIYTGGHNPVLNWKPALRDGLFQTVFGSLYWELNNSNFYLKIRWNGKLDNTYESLLRMIKRDLPDGFIPVKPQCNSRMYGTLARRPIQFSHAAQVASDIEELGNTMSALCTNICRAAA